MKVCIAYFLNDEDDKQLFFIHECALTDTKKIIPGTACSMRGLHFRGLLGFYVGFS